LISAGSWSGVLQDHRRRSLARVAIDIDGHLNLFTMSMEKSTVTMSADLVRAIESAVAKDGTSFNDYLAAAEGTFRTANKRHRTAIRIAAPGAGLPPAVKRRIERLAELDDTVDTIEIRWRQMPDDEFIVVDRHDQTLWLNATYRETILRGEHGSLNDAPLLKTALFLLYEELFRGAYLGPADREKVKFWGDVLTVAAELEWEHGG
jgi:hypothetical protein